jgi:hypothetical protein
VKWSPKIVSHQKLVGNLVLVMEFFVLSFGFFQNITDLLVDVLDPFNEFDVFFDLLLIMGILYMCGCKGN